MGCGLGVRRVSGGESLVQLRRLAVNCNVRFDSGHKGRRTKGNGFGLKEARAGFAVGGGRALPSPWGNKRFARAASRFAR